MTYGDTHAEHRPALFSLPEAAPSMVLRAGRSLTAAGYAADAIAIYEHFIGGLQNHALNPIQDATPGTGTDDDGRAEAALLECLPVRSNPKRYSLA